MTEPSALPAGLQEQLDYLVALSSIPSALKLAQESPPVRSGKNFVYRQCEHCDYLLASTSGAQAMAGEHYCLREGMVTLVRWTP